MNTNYSDRKFTPFFFITLLALVLAGCGGGSSQGSSSNESSTSFTSSSAISITSSVPSRSSASSLSSGSLANSSSSSLARIHLSGSEILGSNGIALTLRGWNWGRWGLVQPEDALDNVAQGANIVRIPLRWWGFYSGTNIDSRDDSQVATAGVDAQHLAVLDETIAQASAAHLWIILFIDSDCGQNGTQAQEDITYCGSTGKFASGRNFWTDPDAREKFINVWKFIAARYKNMPYLAMFEPLPEPAPASASDADINTFYEEVTNAIRPIAPGIPFLIGPRSYQMNRVENAYNNKWNDVIYTANLFVHTENSQSQNIQNLNDRLQHLQNLRTTFNVPVFVQQTGVESGEDPSLIYLNAVLSLLNNSQVGYTYWTYRDTLNPNAYGVIYQDGNGGWVTKTNFLDTISDYLKQ